MTNQRPDPGPYSAEESREVFFETVGALFRYWRDISPEMISYMSGSETHARMEGFLFSLFNLFDGTNIMIPAIDLVPAPHPDDKAYHIEYGEKWWDPSTPINKDTSLHEVFPWEILRK